ncbi:MAG: tetratricopeptide repeat protein [bacterium]|nr:tetratricopeptide repeat protein [bacterium]
MTPERYNALKEMFLAARDLAPAARLAYLAKACTNDPPMLAEVERLLAAHQENGSLPEPSAPPSWHPDRIGRYRICGLLGEGGMGVVYKAEQENPRRTVALKVIRPAVVSKQMLRRFEHEAQLLGRLQHSGIAQIFEAGTAETGQGQQPFFAMELVQGQPLTDYVEANNLATRRRLELLIKVCYAVQHAHSKGIIHRDLKPGNILVTEDGQPKILDFGVARATDSDLQTTTLRTEMGQLMGTIPYMSPEQVAGNAAELDIRSDVYALGVVAYELLAETLPFDLAGRTLPEAVRIIGHDDPMPLSTANKVFSGDLDTILAKALEKDKTRRYQSASDLAADIGRHLHDEPIVARPASAMYQLRKLVARHKVPFALIALLFVSVTVFGISMAILYADSQENLRRALDAEANAATEAGRARREADTAKQTSDFLVSLFEGPDPDQALGEKVTAREILDRGADRIAEELDDSPVIQAALMHTIGNVYYKLGAGDSSRRARELLEAALETRRRELGSQHLDVAATLIPLANLVEADAAESMRNEALQIRQSQLGPDDQLIAEALNDVGVSRFHAGDIAAAEDYFRQALDMRRRVHGDEHVETALTLSNLAFVAQAKGDLATAESLFRESLAMFRKLWGDNHEEVAARIANLAVFVFQHLGDRAEAQKLAREALAIRRRLCEGDHGRLANSLNDLGYLLMEAGTYEEAEVLHREALAMRRRLFGDEHASVAISLNYLALVRRALEDHVEAERYYREALEVCHTTDNAVLLVDTLNNLVSLLQEVNRLDEAEPLLRESLEIRRESMPDDHLSILNTKSILGGSLAALGRHDEAESLLLESYAGIRSAEGEHDDLERATCQRLIDLYTSSGKSDKAAEWRAKLEVR